MTQGKGRATLRVQVVLAVIFNTVLFDICYTSKWIIYTQISSVMQNMIWNFRYVFKFIILLNIYVFREIDLMFIREYCSQLHMIYESKSVEFSNATRMFTIFYIIHGVQGIFILRHFIIMPNLNFRLQNLL